MKIRLLSLLLAFIMVFSICAPITVFADESEDDVSATIPVIPTDTPSSSADKIDISFQIGSSVININGNDVTCEPPFVVNGVTMVPLRVISEAFGSKVEWDGNTQSITLTYREVIMKLIVNNKNAKINDMTLEMLEAPVIYNGNTMVPLRFISENFGADVSYEESTQKVSVTKELTKSSSIKDYAMILKNTSKEMVGDSYYGWMMNMPKNMKLTYRNFTGTCNNFTSSDDEYYIHLDIYKIVDEDETMDAIWANLKNLRSGVTLISQKREDKNGYGYGELSYKDSESVVDRRIYFKNKQLTIIDGVRKIENEKKNKQNMLDIISSFSFGYTKTNLKVEDLSDVDADGYRVFKENKYKWSAKIPADWAYAENLEGENYFYFFAPPKDKNVKQTSGFSLFIFSKENDLSLSQWADRDRKISTDEMNPQTVTVSSLIDKNVGDYSAISYKREISDGKYSALFESSYIYGKSYRYQLNTHYAKDSNERTLLDTIIKSFSFEELDYDDIGDIAEPESSAADDKATQTISTKMKINFKIPANWRYEENDNFIFCYTSSLSNDYLRTFAVNCIPTDLPLGQFVKNGISYITSSTDYEVVKESPQTINNKSGYFVKFEKKAGEDRGTVRYSYFVLHQSKMYVLEFIIDQAIDGKRTKDIFDAVLASVTFVN